MSLMDVGYRIALLPFRRSRIGGRTSETTELLSNTGAYNQAAEPYFERHPNPGFLLDKPFSETHLFAKHLIDVGVC